MITTTLRGAHTPLYSTLKYSFCDLGSKRLNSACVQKARLEGWIVKAHIRAYTHTHTLLGPDVPWQSGWESRERLGNIWAQYNNAEFCLCKTVKKHVSLNTKATTGFPHPTACRTHAQPTVKTLKRTVTLQRRWLYIKNLNKFIRIWCSKHLSRLNVCSFDALLPRRCLGGKPFGGRAL